MICNLRRISVIEAVSYLVLLVAAIVKRAGGTEMGVTVFGPIHGVLFLVFAGMILSSFSDLGWPLWKAIAAIFIGSLPLGGFYIDQSWLKPLQRPVRS
jgi:integral membrane protein